MILLFGDFLLNKGLVSEEALNNALEAQFRDRVLIGQLAIDEGLLTHKEVLQVLRAQRSATNGPRKFAEIGVDLGVLTEEAQTRLLEKQKEGMNFLGNILVSQGVLDPRQLVDAIKEHRALQTESME